MTEQKVEVVEMARAPDVVTSDGPGQALRNARYALRKSETELAKQIKLSKEYIIALENDDYTQLPGAVFIRGYLRVYAHAVNLPADDIIAQFNATAYANAHHVVEAQQMIGTALERPVSYSDKRGRWVMYGIFVFFLIIASVWWNNYTTEHASTHELLPVIAEPEGTMTSDALQ